MSQLYGDFRAIRAPHEQVRAVKVCRSCGQTKPIGSFYVPTDRAYTGWPCKACCMRSSSQQSKVAS